MSRSLSLLHPVLQERLLMLQEEYVRRFGPWSLLVTRTLSTAAEQVALYAQGRQALATVNHLRAAAGMSPLAESESHHTVTDRDGVRVLSEHQGHLHDGVLLSRAVDVVPALDSDGDGPAKAVVDYSNLCRFAPLLVLAEKNGLVWGGAWHSRVDRPHLELPRDVA